jgi:tRNA nucleotidyltransferase (CCA-adding enzyme)
VGTAQGVVEITTFRTESTYSDCRHPDNVQFVGSLDDDLRRRDFTVNAMAYAPNRGLKDLFGGQSDLRRGLIRCVGRPVDRFQEDALRILRALRFAARYHFCLEPETAAAVHACRNLLCAVSGQRIYSELCAILMGQYAGKAIRDYEDVLAVVLPSSTSRLWPNVCDTLDAAPPELSVRLALLFPDADSAQQDLKYLCAPNSILKTVPPALQALSAPLPADKPAARRLIHRLGPAIARLYAQLLALTPGYADTAQMMNAILAHEHCFTVADLAISGKDLLALGCTGPSVGHTLETLLFMVMDEKIPNTHYALLQVAAQLKKRDFDHLQSGHDDGPYAH